MSTPAFAPEDTSLGSEQQAALLRLIEDRAGLRVSTHQARGFGRAFQQVLAQAPGMSAEALYDTLISGQRVDLLELLAANLTVGETHFFRIQPQIDLLREFVLPELIAQHSHSRRLAIWSAGCSTGEEPYTVAILLRELLDASESWNLKILATDINPAALAAARRASYREWAFRDTPSEARERWFTRCGDSWDLIEPVRSMVSFAHQNLMESEPPSPRLPAEAFDLIICRNVTIYFSPEAAQDLYLRFRDKLAPGGWLILGPSDPVPQTRSALEPLYLRGAVLWRRPADASRPELPLRSCLESVAPVVASPRQAHSDGQNLRHSARLPQAGRHAARRAGGASDRGTAGGVSTAATPDRQHMNSSPPDAEVELQTGMLHLDRGDVDSALLSLRRAAFLDADNPLVQFSLARALSQRGQVGRARAALMHARRILAAAEGTQPVVGGDGISVGELRHGIEVQLGMLRNREQGS